MPAAALHLRTFATEEDAAQRLRSLSEVHGPRLHLVADVFPALVRFTFLENLQVLRDALPPGRRVSDADLLARLTAAGFNPAAHPAPPEQTPPLERLVFLTLRATVDPEAVVVIDLATHGRALVRKNTGHSLISLILPDHSIAPFEATEAAKKHLGLHDLQAKVAPLASACRRLLIFTRSPEHLSS